MGKTGPMVLVVGALLLAAPVPTSAQTQEQPQLYSPVLTVDQERLFTGSRVAERVSAEIERRTQELATENREIEADLTAQELALTERRPKLSPTEFRALADAFDVKVQAIRIEQDEKARALQRLQEQEQQNFLRRISPVLAEIVRERRAVVVLDRRTVFLSADSLDITDEAIARINEVLAAEEAGTAQPAPDPAVQDPGTVVPGTVDPDATPPAQSDSDRPADTAPSEGPEQIPLAPKTKQ